MGTGSVTGTRPSSLALRLASDNRLAKLAASGDERAFTAIYNGKYLPALPFKPPIQLPFSIPGFGFAVR